MPPQTVKQVDSLVRGEERTKSARVPEAKKRHEQSPDIVDLLEYVRKIAPPPPAFQAIRAEAKRNGTDKLTMAQIDREVAAVRRQHSRKKEAKQTKR